MSLFLSPYEKLLSLGPAMGACEWSSGQGRCCRGFQGSIALLSQGPLGSLVAPEGWGKSGFSRKTVLNAMELYASSGYKGKFYIM